MSNYRFDSAEPTESVADADVLASKKRESLVLGYPVGNNGLLYTQKDLSKELRECTTAK